MSADNKGRGAKTVRRNGKDAAGALTTNPFGPGKGGNPFAVLPDAAVSEPPTSVDRSREIARHFMTATELINPLIERAEKALAALRLGVSASVPIYDADEGWVTSLCFQKSGNEWVLTKEEGHVSDPDSWKSTRLTTTSRAMRLRCLALLPELEKALVEKADAELNEAIGTVTAAADYLNDLEARTK
ncbi:MAG TPA: hypothetical protein VNG33_01770 [Polyangiaceae bacterium]|nr:hypothetical protein [Polyangiaceae bacterium]